MNLQHENPESEEAEPLNFEGLVRLNVPVPSNLERALGYQPEDNPSRFVGFYWEPGTLHDELAYYDGRVLLVGAVWLSWLTYKAHPRVIRELCNWEFGHHGQEAKALFILDRVERTAYVALRARAFHFLKAQHGLIDEVPEPAATPQPRAVSGADLEAMFNAPDAWLNGFNDPDGAQKLVEEHSEHDKMLAELDGWRDVEQVDNTPSTD